MPLCLLWVPKKTKNHPPGSSGNRLSAATTYFCPRLDLGRGIPLGVEADPNHFSGPSGVHSVLKKWALEVEEGFDNVLREDAVAGKNSLGASKPSWTSFQSRALKNPDIFGGQRVGGEWIGKKSNWTNLKVVVVVEGGSEGVVTLS